MNMNNQAPDDLLLLRQLIIELTDLIEPFWMLFWLRMVLRALGSIIDTELKARCLTGHQVEFTFAIFYPDADDAEPDETQPLPAPPDMEHWNLDAVEHFNAPSTVQPVYKPTGEPTAFTDFVNSLDLPDPDEEL